MWVWQLAFTLACVLAGVSFIGWSIDHKRALFWRQAFFRADIALSRAQVVVERDHMGVPIVGMRPQ